MKINPIHTYNLTCIKKINNNETSAPASTSKPLSQLTYPSNYYIGFKQSEKGITCFDAILDYLYEKNKDKPLRSVNKDIRLYYPVTYSRALDNAVQKFISNELKSIEEPLIDKAFLTEIVEKGLGYLNSSEKVEDIWPKMEDKYNICINERTKLSYDELASNSFNGKGIISQIAEVLDRDKVPGYFSDYGFDTQIRAFIKSANGYLNENYKFPVFDEKLLNDLKTKLHSFEPLKKYAALGIEVSSSPHECASNLYDDIINKHINPFDNEKFYEYHTKNFNKIDFQLEKLYNNIMKDQYIENLKYGGIAEKHKVLLADPCVAFRSEELAEFVKSNNIDTEALSPFELRKIFSEYLGKKTVYRGVRASNDVGEKIKNDGTFAHAFVDKEKAIKDIAFYLSPEWDREDTHWDKILDKIKYRDKKSPYLSVSTEYDIAASVPKNYDSNSSVVVKAEIPKLSMIEQKKEYYNMQTSRIDDVLKVGQKRYKYNTDQHKIEAFVPFYISPEFIDVTIDEKVPAYEWL